MLSLVRKNARHPHPLPAVSLQRATLVTANELRSKFLQYFQSKGHTIVPGSSVIPEDDPSLLFVNAGMNQFKKYYLGELVPWAFAWHLRSSEKRRLTTSQLCIRAGGKHNDLDNIGFTPRHQTMFEMLGNFSLGDYYKEEAIAMAYDFVTREIGIPREHLRVSVHEKDDVARELWKKIGGFPDACIVNRGNKDNFWSMGSEDSPSGYCSEIFYTTDPQSTYDDWLEIWNIVFMNTRNQGGWIDTGMGCERMLSVLNHVHSNFETDCFAPLIESIHSRFPSLSASHQIIFADHLRTSVVLAGEIFPSSKGRGYVMRKIVRRLLRYAYLNAITEPFMGDFVPAVIEMMQEQVPTLPARRNRIERILRNEEEFFWRAVMEGKKAVSSKLKKSNSVISMETLHRYHSDTGLPVEMILTLLEEEGIPYDKQQVAAWMNEEVRLGEGTRTGNRGVSLPSLPPQHLMGEALTSWEPGTAECSVVFDDGRFVELDPCPFYPTQAGQEGDCGEITLAGETVAVKRTLKTAQRVVCEVTPHTPHVGAPAQCRVDATHRQRVATHHTATHLLHGVLREQAGCGQSLQEGSRIDADGLTFDFYAGFLSDRLRADTAGFLREVEKEVNDLARAALPVVKQDFSKQQLESLPKGSFIGDIVRISGKDSVFHTVSIGASREFCCGQHARCSSDVYPFVITGMQSVSAGIKRIEAKAGRAGIDALMKNRESLQEVSRLLKVNEDAVVKRVASVVKENGELEEKNRGYLRMALQNLNCSYSCVVEGLPVAVYELPDGVSKELIDKMMMQLKEKRGKECSLIVQNKSFVLLGKEGVKKEEMERLKSIVFEVGKGGKGGGKKGVVKGVCNASLLQKEEAFKQFA